MVSLRSKLLIPTFMVAGLFMAAIAYIAIIQYEMFRQQTENIQLQEEKQLHVFIDEMQQQTRHFLELLSNKWHFIDSVSVQNMDALLNEITPFNKGPLGNFVTVYDMEGNIIAQAEDPGIFDKPDELHPHILKMKTGPITQSILSIYKDTLLVLELKRLENNYETVGVLAVGHYITQEEVDEFARLRQSHLILNYNNTPLFFSNGSRLHEDIHESTIKVKFEENFGKESPLTAFLYMDTSKMETEYCRNLIIIIIILVALSSMVLFFSRLIVWGTVNALDGARMLSERELARRKQAELALKKFNVELEILVQERTEKLQDEISERKLAEEELTQYREHLEVLVKKRTEELEDSNKEIKKSQQAMRYLLEDVNEARMSLEISNESLERANRDLESFSYSVSHDLRTPLRSIIGFSSILEERIGETADSETLRLMSVISESTIKMQALINDLLNFSRIGRIGMIFNTINMYKLVSEICSNYTENTEESDTEFDILTLPDAAGSYSMIKQVFINLIENAVKFTRTVDSPLITIGSQISEGITTYYVKDNGSGFDMKFSDKIFDIFARLHNNKRIEGTGVGLAIVKQIIERHGGLVRAESEPGRGAAFYFTLSDKSEG